MKQKRLIMMLAVLAAAGAAMAQGNGQAGITEATQLVTGYFDPGTKLVYAVGAIIGLPEIQFGRPRHLENRQLMVRSLHFPDSGRHYPEVILPLRTDKRQ